MILLREWQAQGATFDDLDGRSHLLALADLAELASEGRDGQTGQRLPGFCERFSVGSLTGVEERPDCWRFMLADGHAFTVTREAALNACESPLWQVQRELWPAEEVSAFPVHDFAEVLVDDEALRLCLLAVARLGFARLRGAAAQGGAVERLVARFGLIRETNYGRIFDVIATAEPNNLAYTAMRLPPHTDNPYRASPPELQLLHCLAAAASGGETLLVDGWGAAEQLRAHNPRAFDLLAQTPVQFAWSDAHHRLTAIGTTIELNAAGEIIRLRCNDRSRTAVLAEDATQQQQWREALAELTAFFEQRSFSVGFRLDPGDMLIIDNRRVLHGRGEFVQAGTLRHLQGAYADADGLLSTLFRLTEQTATQTLSGLGDMFAGAAMSQSYGEDLSIRDHMLQTAELAVARRLGAAMVTAALLHDIGWALGDADGAGEHQHVAADVMAPLLGTEIAEIVRHHVAAKRYLVANRPGYADCLSAESRRTLARQGGPMSAEESAHFAAVPHFAAALQLRALDDAGKDLRAPASAFSDYAPLVYRQLVKHKLGPS